MSQPVKLSDELVCDARATADACKRSIAGQIEFWAQLGRSVEPILRGDRVVALQHAGATRPLSQAIASVDSQDGRRRVAEYLATKPFPHFKPIPNSGGLLQKTDEDGTQTIGRFVNRVFVPVDS